MKKLLSQIDKFLIKQNNLIAAGLAVVAKDSGRVLLLQRALQDNKNGNGGLWEIPGGHIKDVESAFSAAVREWAEETGNKLPKGKVINSWLSSNGIYQGYVYLIPSEKDIDLNLNRDTRAVSNPDGDFFETLAFWNIDLLPDNPALRPEMQDMDWDLLKVQKSMNNDQQLLKSIDLFLRKHYVYKL